MSNAWTVIVTYAPFVVSAVVGIGVLLDRAKGTTESGGNLVTSWLQTSRRVQTERRDGEIESLQEQIDGLREMVTGLQAQVRAHQTTIDALIRDLAQLRSYGWLAWSEIQRLDPSSSFARPPETPSLSDGHTPKP